MYKNVYRICHCLFIQTDGTPSRLQIETWRAILPIEPEASYFKDMIYLFVSFS